jgi:hypothetical protein
MGDENLQVIEITLTFELLALILEVGVSHTVITPWSSEKLLDVGVTTLLLSHHCADELKICIEVAEECVD